MRNQRNLYQKDEHEIKKKEKEKYEYIITMVVVVGYAKETLIPVCCAKHSSSSECWLGGMKPGPRII